MELTTDRMSRNPIAFFLLLTGAVLALIFQTAASRAASSGSFDEVDQAPSVGPEANERLNGAPTVSPSPAQAPPRESERAKEKSTASRDETIRFLEGRLPSAITTKPVFGADLWPCGHATREYSISIGASLVVIEYQQEAGYNWDPNKIQLNRFGDPLCYSMSNSRRVTFDLSEVDVALGVPKTKEHRRPFFRLRGGFSPDVIQFQCRVGNCISDSFARNPADRRNYWFHPVLFDDDTTQRIYNAFDHLIELTERRRDPF